MQDNFCALGQTVWFRGLPSGGTEKHLPVIKRLNTPISVMPQSSVVGSPKNKTNHALKLGETAVLPLYV